MAVCNGKVQFVAMVKSRLLQRWSKEAGRDAA